MIRRIGAEAEAIINSISKALAESVNMQVALAVKTACDATNTEANSTVGTGVATFAAVPALAVMASTFGGCPQSGEPGHEHVSECTLKAVNKQTILLAALVAVQSIDMDIDPEAFKHGDMVGRVTRLDLCLDSFRRAFKDFEKLTGEKPDKYLKKGFAKAVNNPASTVDDFMRSLMEAMDSGQLTLGNTVMI